MKKGLWIVVAVLIVIGLVAVRMKRSNEKESAPTLEAVRPVVETVVVGEGHVAETRHVLGTVIGSEEAAVAARVMAQVMEVRVREGDRVTSGQELAVLDPRELQDAVAKAEAGVGAAREGLAAAETAYQAQRDATARDRTLFEAKAIAQEQWDRSKATEKAAGARLEAARAQVEVATSTLDQARTRLGYCHLSAPFEGVVAARLADPGDLAVPGKPIVRLVHARAARVRAEVPPEDFTALAPGRRVTLASGEATAEATISRVFPAMGTNHLAAFEVDLDVPPPGFVSGATVGVDVELGSARGVRVPIDSLLEGERATHVFKVDNGVVEPVAVEVISRSLEDAVISGAVVAGDELVVARPSRLMMLAPGVEVRTVGASG